MKLTLINSALTAEIDDEDFGLASLQWSLVQKRNKQYASARINERRVYLHRYIMGEPVGMVVDHHPDPNGLNCRRSNLRICTRSENMGNAKKHDDGSGQFKGVYYESSTGKHVAQICVQRQRIKIGRFDDAQEAARAYDQKAIELFGIYAKTNFQNES